MQFFRTIKKSVFDRAFYAAAKEENSSPALKYYTLLVLCVAIIISIPMYVSLGVWISRVNDTDNIRTKALAIYPDELALTFQNGQATSNVEEPYPIPMPPEFSIKDAPENLIIINTLGTITPDDFDRYNTSVILAGDALWIRDTQKNKIEIQKFDQFIKEPFVINKQKVIVWVDIALKVGKVLVIALLIFLPFILFSLFWCGYLIYLIFGALIIWLVAKLRKVNLTYGQSYKLGLYLLTLPILYSLLTTGPLAILKIPFGFTLILFAITYANFGLTKIVEETPPVPENT